jgi:predicted methyltransferase
MKILALAVVVAACSHGKTDPPAATPAAIVANADRTEHDRKLDPGRKPVETLTFFGTASGMHVADLGAGAGYTTELVARSVGSSGTVIAQDTPNWGGPGLDKLWVERLARPGMTNTTHVMRQWDAPLPPEAKSLDAVYFVCAYHDVVAEKSDPNKLDQAVFAALKSGGTYVVIDNSARDGSGTADCEKLHRIDEKIVRDNVLRAGFKLDSEAAFLRNPADTRDWNADPGGDPKPDPRAHTQDRFVLKFVKP